MIINGVGLVLAKPIEDMSGTKNVAHGTSWGLSEAGYDFRIQQTIKYTPPKLSAFTDLIKKMWLQGLDYVATTEDHEAQFGYTEVWCPVHKTYVRKLGRTALVSSVEKFNIPQNIWADFKNKSTHARKFLDASFSTDGEPGWKGHLTIELVFHDLEPVTIYAGSGILKAVFHETKELADYGATLNKKYQDQPDKPIPSLLTM